MIDRYPTSNLRSVFDVVEDCMSAVVYEQAILMNVFDCGERVAKLKRTRSPVQERMFR